MRTANPNFNNKVVTIKGKYITESPKAVRFQVIDGDEHHDPQWFPFSQIKKIFKASPGSTQLDELIISEWIAKEKGIVEK
jgi:hypothetical protein